MYSVIITQINGIQIVITNDKNYRNKIHGNLILTMRLEDLSCVSFSKFVIYHIPCRGHNFNI